MIKLFLWLIAITAIILSGTATVVFAATAHKEKDRTTQEFFIGASSACGFLFFISVVTAGLFCL